MKRSAFAARRLFFEPKKFGGDVFAVLRARPTVLFEPSSVALER